MKKQNKRRMSVRIRSLLLIAIMLISSIPVAFSQKTYAGSKASQYELIDKMQDAAILHCWNWSYETIEENLELIAQCGYSAVQTSPASQPKDYTYEGVVGMEVGTPGYPGTGNWWKLYQPVTFDVCDNGQTWLGTKSDLESLCAKAEEYGIKVIVDIVANHLGNIKGWQNSMSDISPQVGQYFNPDMMTDQSFWHINDLQIWMSDGREHFTQGTMGMPDLNTADKRVQGYVAAFLDELIDCGVDGFRFDAAKHIETPDDDPAFASDFWPTVLNEAKSHYRNTTGGDLYVYGEILNTVGDNFSINSYTKYMSVTDNSAGHHLLESFRNNNIGSLNMHYAPELSLIWAESHDTYMNESSRYSSDQSIVRTWAMVANKDNAASLYFARPYYSKDILVNDIDGQMKGNLDKELTPATMGACETYTWASKEVAAINHFNNRMSNITGSMGSDGRIAYCVRGDGIVLANFDGSGQISMSAHGMSNGTYTDEVSGNTFTVSNGTISGKIDSEFGVAVVYKNVMPNPDTSYPVQIKSSVGDGTTFYSDSLQVTISALYANNASYTTSTGQSGRINGETTITIGSGLKKGESVTLTVTGSNKSGTVNKEYTYYKDEYDLENCIFFKNTQNWSGVTAYAWNDTTTPSVSNAGWPGEAMYECDPVNNIYALKIDPNAGYTKIIFSNSGASQTKDLSIGSIGYMYNMSTLSWTKYQDDNKTPVINSSLASSTISGETDITFTVTNSQKSTYSINGSKAVEFNGSVTLTAGKDLKVGESDNIVITAVNGDKSNTKTFTYTMDCLQPVIVASVNSGTTFNGSLEVTFTTVNAENASITINGVTQNFTDSITKVLTDTTTVKVDAVNGTKTASETYKYTRVYSLPSISITPSTDTTFTDTLYLTITASNADEAYYQIGNLESVKFTNTVTVAIGADMDVNESVIVKVTASNADGSAAPITKTYTKVDVEQGYNIYLNVNTCSWFGNDSAVAAVKIDSETEYTKMNSFTNSDGVKLYYFEVPADASKVSIVRMLPSGLYYNENIITLKNGIDYYISNSNWSGISAGTYNGSLPGVVEHKTPVIKVTPVGGTYENSVDVTISVTNAQSATYQIDNGDIVSINATTTITLTKSATLKVNAVNGDKTASSSNDYVIKTTPITDMITLYFTNNNGWSNVNAYTWGGSKTTTIWPGDTMTYVGLNEFNQKVYKVSVSADIKGLIFNNGSGSQTVDITSGFKDGLGYYISGTSGSKCLVESYIFGS